MDLVGGVPPPIRRASREALELQKALDEFRLETNGFARDDAAPPPIRRLRTSSLGASPPRSFSKSPVASPKPSGLPLSQSAVPSRYATPPARTVILPYPQDSTSFPLPNRTPAPIPRRPPHLDTHTTPAPTPNTYAPPLPNKSPLRSRPEPQPLKPKRPSHTRNFSHPFRDQSQLQSQPPLPSQPPSQPKHANTLSYRNPPRPLSYRNIPHMPYSLRRWSSLETIDSVQTWQELSRENSFEDSGSTPTTDSTNTSSSKRQYLSFCDDEEDEHSVAGDIPGTPPASGVTLPRTPSDHSRPQSSASSSVQSTSATMQGSGSKRSTAASIIRKLKRGKAPEPLLTTESLEIEKRVSLDQRSHSNSSNSTMTMSSGRLSELAFPGFSQGSTSQLSLSSKDWKSSNFDTSGLSEAELKKCKKKSINPALYAEMKAARKGRFVSPIGGNTFI